MADLNDLALRLQTLARDDSPNSFAQRANNAKIYVATQVLVNLIQATPVDTSQALSNWQASLDTPAIGKLPAYVPGVQGSTDSASMNQAIAAGVRVLREARPGQSIFISNNLPYIQRLNEGSSAQAPAGFVERAQLIGRKAAENVKF